MGVYEIVTERILEQLNKGVVPWAKPWVDNGKGGIFRHQNFKSKHAYRGVNAMLCSVTSRQCPYWLTYKQATEMGGQVRKGEKGTLITFWKIWEREQNDTKKKVPVFRYFTVFNLEQIDGIEWSLPEAEPIPEGRSYDILTGYLANEGPKLRHDNQDQAFYRSSEDLVSMPNPSQFNSEDDYYQTLYHELAHSTGPRVGRTMGNSNGSSDYAKEELIAEMAGAMLMAHAGREPKIQNSAAYISSWLQRLQNDPKLVVVAASAAEKAVERILEPVCVPA